MMKEHTLKNLARIIAMVLAALALWSMKGGPASGDLAADGNPFVARAIHVDEFGAKWFGTSRGLLRNGGTGWIYYTNDENLGDKEVLDLAFEPSASGPRLWIATINGVSVVAYNVDGVTAATSYTVQDGLLNDTVTAIAVDDRNNKFFGSRDGIIFFHSGTMDTIRYADYVTSMVGGRVNDLAHRSDSIYIAQNGGIGRLISGVDGITGASRWTSEYGMTPLSGNIYAVMIDSKGHQWFGTDEGAEEHVGPNAKENWRLFTTGDGLVHNFVESIEEDPEGGIWFGTHGGASHVYNDTWTSYTAGDGLASDTVYDIAFDADTVWMATHRGISRLVDGQFQETNTSSQEQAATEVAMTSSYLPGEDAILLTFNLPGPSWVEARLYSVNGSLLAHWNYLPGSQGWNRVKLPLPVLRSGGPAPGICILQMTAGGHIHTSKLIIVQ